MLEITEASHTLSSNKLDFCLYVLINKIRKQSIGFSFHFID